MTLADRMLAMGAAARDAAAVLRTAPAEQRTHGIAAMARHLRESAPEILASNARDVEQASGNFDRLLLDEVRVEAMAAAIEQVANLTDPVGRQLARWQPSNGLDIARVSAPIGVIGMIYESRPNVTADAAAICLRSGNAVILRSGSEALESARAIHSAILSALAEASLPAEAVQLVDTPDRGAVDHMLKGLDNAIDLLIPRGGRELVNRVREMARVATLGHLEGVCHTYIHESADPSMAARIVANAKLRRPGICGATETLLIDAGAAGRILPIIAAALPGCELRGDKAARAVVPMKTATESDWSTEYLAPVLAVRVVAHLDEALTHISKYGTGHTEAIIAEDRDAAEAFLHRLDSAIGLWNASTQFADGGEFGFGAEIGIATGKLHARGPVGPEQLTTFRYVVRGCGQVRA